MKGRARLDTRLLELGLVSSRARAQACILAGLVSVDGAPQHKAGFMVKPESLVELSKPVHPYVSRGGVKLAHALQVFNFSPAGMLCLDVGASTGGFTDCLLRHGAAKVVAVDVGYGQLAYKLRQDVRVELFERLNFRHIAHDVASGPFDLIVADVSFISLTMLMDKFAMRLATGGHLLCLVKPQFEVGKDLVEKGGVVKDQATRLSALHKVEAFAQSQGLTSLANCESPIAGPAGNVEFLLLLQKSA